MLEEMKRSGFSMMRLAVSALALWVVGANIAKGDLTLALQDVDGTLLTTVSGDLDGREILSGGGDVAIIFGPGLGIGYASLSYHIDNLFGSLVDPFTALLIQILPNEQSFVQTEVYMTDGSLTDGQGIPIDCSSLSFCTMTQDDAVYPVVDIAYTDGTVDHVTFQWVVTPEPTSLLLLVTVAISIFAFRRARTNGGQVRPVATFARATVPCGSLPRSSSYCHA